MDDKNILLNSKEFCNSYKSCKFTDSGSCIMEARFGKLTIFIPDEKGKAIRLCVKKISGNGKISVNGILHTITSKNFEEIDISRYGNKLEIIRPSESLGEINVLGVKILKKDEMSKTKWKNIISKCGNHKSIRMVENRLFASVGGYLENATVIDKIETNPPSAFYIEDGIVKFSNSCEITDIVLKDTDDVSRKFVDFTELKLPYPSVLSSAPDKSTAMPPRLRTRNVMTQNLSTPLQTSIENSEFSKIIYNSDTVREFNSAKHTPDKTGFTKYLKSNGKDYLVIKRGGVFTVPISKLQPNSEYLVQLSVQKLNGNGKIHIGAFSNNTFIGTSCIVENNSQIHSLKFVTNSEHGQKLQIRMMEDGSGEVLIGRIILLSKDPLEQPFTTVIPTTQSYKRFVIVIPSYKNIRWCQKNLHSVLNQNYENYRVIYTDDDSPDGTFDKVSSIVKSSGKADKFTLIHNTTRIGALQNLHNMIHSCDDEEIILTLDGDDWLANENVLSTLNNYYSNNDVWMTYGQYKNYPDERIGISEQIPDNVIKSHSYRKYRWCSSHLRTFYAWLFKQIKLEDFKYENKFMSMAWDMTMMFPMLEMASTHSKFIPDILYIYNLENPINDHKVNVALQQKLDRYVRGMPTYAPISHRPKREDPKMKIGLLIIATHKYSKFIAGLISSADNYFMNQSEYDVTYFLFTDKQQHVRSKRNVVQTFIEHRPFPFASMDRFKNFTKHSDVFKDQDYLFYIDVDCLFIDNVSSEILGNLVGVRHCGFVNQTGTYETNPASLFYVGEDYPKKYKYYFGGGFSGGKKDSYLELARVCSERIDLDVANGIIPVWHDETAINRYFLDNEPDVILDPGYHYPQGNIERYKKMWAPLDFQPKILLLDKNHQEVRK